jgi:hypothetical protein
VHSVRLHPFEFLFEASLEIVDAVFKNDKEAKREESEENEPKQPADQGHAGNTILLTSLGQRLPLERANFG